MLVKEQKLNPKVFDSDVQVVTTRKGFGIGLVLAAEKDKNVVGLTGDLTESTFMHLFKERFKDRFIQVGIAEQNMMSVASGMASMGKIPFISSYSIFSPGRNWEQLRTTVCYNNTNVKIIGTHAGLSVGPDGGSHQALEDIAITSVIPRLMVLCPCDAIEAKKATLAASKINGPVYIRLSRHESPVITTEDTPFEIGKAQIFFDGTSGVGKADIGIIATGHMVHRALLSANELLKKGIKAKVMNISSIKPLDEDAVWRLAHETGAIVTVEDHQISGGLGSVISQCLAKHYPVPVEFIGVDDEFGQSGKPDELYKHYNMDIGDIINAVHKALIRK